MFASINLIVGFYYKHCFSNSNTNQLSFHVKSRKMADKLRTLQNLEALQARYIGTGHADTTKYEWVSNILRDSYSSYIGHPPLLSYMAVGLGEPKEKVRAMMIDKMIRGAGNPPEVQE
jgi:splicing factor 3B subunit 5